MDFIFITKLIASFLIGGVWIVLTTIAADKYGSKIGGLIAGLPSTGLFSLFFLGWTQNAQFAVQATTIIPIIVGVENIFVLTYIYLVKKNFWVALITAFLIWFFLAFALLFLKFNNYALSLLGYLVSILCSYFIVENIFKIKSVAGQKINYTTQTILLRGLIGGLVIALVVFLGKIGGPILGGIFSGFPAMFTSTMLITYFSHGPEFSAATMKSSLISIVSLVIFSIMVRYTYLPLGIILGTLVSTLVSFTSGVIVYNFVVKKLR